MKVKEDRTRPHQLFHFAVCLTGIILSYTLLIVDDEAEVADTCARVLKRAGYDCLVAYDSPAALALFDSRQPALILSDINLPHGNGFEIARYVRGKSPATPVILMTAYHD